jgi:uncharacterized protein YndB with AHSA1/START domain
MAQRNPTTVSAPSDREIVVCREFDAPVALVWSAWTKPEHLAKWWGPKGFTTTIEDFDLKPGGHFKQTMHGPDGTNYPNLSVFREIVPEQRIVYSHGGGREDGGGAHFDATWTFEALAKNRTRVTGRSVFATREDRDRVVREFNAIEGGRQTLARLAQHVARLGSDGDELVIVRDVAAPVARVWRAWTNVDELRRWWGPKGFRVTHAELDLRVGGTFHYGLVSPTGFELWGKFLFREITPNERLVYVTSFSDAQGGTTRHPMAEGWPLHMLNAFTFLENDGGSTLTMRTRAHEASEAERAVFRNGFDSMRGGYGGTYDQLESHLARA